MNKNTFLAIVLSMLIIISWPFIIKTFFPEMMVQPGPPVSETQTLSEESTQGSNSDMLKSDAVFQPDTAPIDKDTIPAAAIAVLEENLTTIETSKLVATISTKGAAIKSISLKPIDEMDKENIPLFDITDTEKPYSLSFLKFSGISKPENIRYSVAKKDPLSVTLFAYLFDKKILIERTYTFEEDSYFIDVTNTIKNVDTLDPVQFEGSYEILVASKLIEEKTGHPYCYASFLGTTTKTAKFEKSFGKDIFRSYNEPMQWASLQNKYFAHVLIADSIFESTHIRRKKDEEECLVYAKRKDFSIPSGNKITDTYKLYSGPKDYEKLKQYGADLDKLINFGRLGPLCKGLVAILTFFYGIFHNYGVAIIFLTIVVKLILHPLTQKSFASMKAMKEISPKVNALREKYKSDPQKLNKETMALYKKEGINPMGGCFPMLLQMPVFFALFSTLRNSFALRHAPFVFWLQDLSAKDPYYILPIVMGGTMILQQKMTPAAGDPNQQKMMMFMPVIFTFLFINFPSGLVLYWLVNNILTISHQAYFNRK